MFDFSWATFIYSIVNFVLLVAILYRVLHKPLMDVLERRQQEVEEAKAAAERKEEQARKTQQEYEGRLANIEEERDRILSEAREKAEEARQSTIEKAREGARREVDRLKRDWERRRQDALEQLREDIVDLALDLARRALEDLSDRDVESRLLDRLQAELESLGQEADERTRRELFAAEGPVRVVSASELDDERRDAIRSAVAELGPDSVEVDFEVDASLVAGARVEFSSRAVDATLEDVLAAVRERYREMAPEEEGEGQ